MQIVLRNGMNIGKMSAEDDEKLLVDSYIDTESAQALGDIDDSKCVVLGRTGSGKSAMLWDIETKNENVIRINPEALSLNFISNSDILKFFNEMDVKLDVFYQLLWRHVFAVELIKSKQKIQTESQSKNLVYALFERFSKDPKKTKALNYLFEYGNSFWADTEERVRQVVSNIESRLSEESGVKLSDWVGSFLMKSSEERSESTQEVKDVIYKAQKVVNQVQIQELENVIDLLSEDIFNDKLEKHYIIIDDLDKDWAHDDIRYDLIRALIETLRKFRRVNNVKIIIGMRIDLFETILERSNKAGFQREKYEDLFLRLRWTSGQLRELADRRISNLFKDQYTGKEIGLNDVLANKVGQVESFEYILERTLGRPRDVISFMNECLNSAAGQTKISNKSVRAAEVEYSSSRLLSLADEWREYFGDLEPAFRVLKEFGVRFTYAELDSDKLDVFCLAILDGVKSEIENRAFSGQCQAYFDQELTENGLRNEILSALYIVGVIGIKVDSHSAYEWSHTHRAKLDLSRINDGSKLAVHPMLHKALGIYAAPSSISL